MDQEPAAPKANNKNPLLILLVLLLIFLAAAAFWYFFLNKPSEETTKTNEKTATTSAETATEQSTTLSDEELIKKALVAKTGISADIISVTISQKVDGLAKGLVGAKGEEVGGGYFLTVKINGEWVIVFDGQNTPNCSSVNPHNFPTSMVPECLDAEGNVVTR